MRAALILFVFFLILALSWAVLPTQSANHALECLENGYGDPVEHIHTLRGQGLAGGRALRQGLHSSEPRVRLLCARELAFLGDADGDTALLLLMQDRSSVEAQTLASAAETHVINAWMERSAPPASERRKALRYENDGTIPERIASITDALEDYPTWAAGYVFRARLLLAAERAAEARRDTLLALYLQPDQFEAMVLLARAWSLLERNDLAAICIERAIKVNPRLHESLDPELESLQKSLLRDRARERREKQRNQPLA